MATYKVVEKFISINGEGTKAGQLAVFIRFAGCNLNCSYCDTAWANKENVPVTEMTEFEIYDYIKNTGVKNVTLTGGEPLLRDDVDKLLKLLSSDKSIKVEIETNGSIDLYDYRQISDNISFTVDYKLPSSCMEHLMEMENFEELEERDTVKFVVSDNNDLLRAKEIIDEYKLTGQCSVYLSPVFGKIDPQEIVDFMIRNHLNGVNLQLQLHKIIWDPDKKGV